MSKNSLHSESRKPRTDVSKVLVFTVQSAEKAFARGIVELNSLCPTLSVFVFPHNTSGLR